MHLLLGLFTVCEHCVNNTTIIIIIEDYYALAYKSAGQKTVSLTLTPQLW